MNEPRTAEPDASCSELGRGVETCVSSQWHVGKIIPDRLPFFSMKWEEEQV